jgi:predicted NACHT family NTPase
MQKADYLLRLMKQRTDELVASDEKLQQFLMWVNEKSLSVALPYKPLAIRAFYINTVFARDLGLTSDTDRNRDIAFIFNLDVYLSRDFDIALDFNLSRLLVRLSDYYIAIDQHDYELIGRVDHGIEMIFANIFALNLLTVELRQALEQFQKQRHQQIYNIFSQKWWQPKKSWIKQLRVVMIQHRNIGHDWQFSEQQKKLLKEYYEANLLLVDCLNSTCNVTFSVRQEIEETLLLPIAEIKKKRS